MRKTVGTNMKIEAKTFEKWSQNESNMCENWSQNESKLAFGGFLGLSGRPLGALWVSRCVPRLETSFEGRVLGALWGIIFGRFSQF